MKLHNTLTRSVEPFQPLDDNRVRMYSCGPTVYDHIHIGNLSAFIVADTLRRALQASKYNVTHVMNFTDVDDKTIRRSQEQYPNMEPMSALQKLTEYYGDLFLEDMAKVGNDVAAYTFVKATDAAVIAGMQALIKELHDGGFAYIADDGVYFSIDAYKKSGKIYGQLSNITSSSTSEARIQNDEYDKASAHDFALWKVQKGQEPAWAFTLDGHDLTGRPGWHIECSVMSSQNAGLPFDIHTGGIDLVFPHHENEIAQSTAGRNDPTYARFFVHNEHILIDGKKMSKSLGNFYRLQDITDKGFDPIAFRVLVLQSHYRSQLHFTWDNLAAAQNRLAHWREAMALQWQPQALPASDEGTDIATLNDALASALADDLDTAKALQLIDAATDKMLSGKLAIGSLRDIAKIVENTLGIDLFVDDINETQKQLIATREQARTDKDWAASDNLRDQLTEQGIGVRDDPTGTIWFYL